MSLQNLIKISDLREKAGGNPTISLTVLQKNAAKMPFLSDSRGETEETQALPSFL